MADVFPHASVAAGPESEIKELETRPDVTLTMTEVSYKTVGTSLSLFPEKTYLMNGMFKLYRLYHQHESDIRRDLQISGRYGDLIT